MPATFTPASPTSDPLNLTMTREKTATWNIAATQSDGVTPQDLTGGTLYFYAQIGSVLISKSSNANGGIVITSLTGGAAVLVISPADTANVATTGVNSGPCELTLQHGIYNYELASGTLTVFANVSVP